MLLRARTESELGFATCLRNLWEDRQSGGNMPDLPESVCGPGVGPACSIWTTPGDQYSLGRSDQFRLVKTRRTIDALSDIYASMVWPSTMAIASISNIKSGYANARTSQIVSAGYGAVNTSPRNSTTSAKYDMSVTKIVTLMT